MTDEIVTDEIKHENHGGHGDYERRDIGIAGIVYFIVGLAVATFVVHLLLAGLYDFLDKRARTRQPAVNPLIENVPADTRKIPPRYPDTAFPEPRLETDERGQLNEVRLGEERTLSTYGWVDEQAGIVRIPIERAMDLLSQRGLPVRQDAATEAPAAATNATNPGGESNGIAAAATRKKGSGQ
jgi:hypothetical protein